MLIRKPAVAGHFYSADKTRLQGEVHAYLERAQEGSQKNGIWGVMLPHAGHIFCGDIIGKTLAGWKLPEQLIILCPNHTGSGRPLGVWMEGAWMTPLGLVPVDEPLARELVETGAGFEPDMASHAREHSIEVLLPFLQELNKNLRIVPVTVGVRNKAILERAGLGLAEVLRRNPGAGVIISSDMNHYESHQKTLAKDDLALAQAMAGNAGGLMEVVERESISMCGAAPLAITLYAAKALDRTGVELTAHTTSGPVSGDYGHTVGYAGLHLLAE